MAIIRLGPIIKGRREVLNLTQEDLADGICSVATLSRIENGERLPTKAHLEMLLQRLGYSADSFDIFSNQNGFLIHELKYKIRWSFINDTHQTAAQYLAELEALMIEPSRMDKQFLMLYKILLNQESRPGEKLLYQLESALKLTCPNYTASRIPCILSYEEIILLNNIALCYDECGDREQAIAIFLGLKNYYDQHIINTEEALRTEPMILYNLSKSLAESGHYDECVEVCNRGIRLARSTGRCLHLGKTQFVKGWAMILRNHPGDIDAARESLTNAYYFSRVMAKDKDAERIQNLYISAFHEVI